MFNRSTLGGAAFVRRLRECKPWLATGPEVADRRKFGQIEANKANKANKAMRAVRRRVCSCVTGFTCWTGDSPLICRGCFKMAARSTRIPCGRAAPCKAIRRPSSGPHLDFIEAGANLILTNTYQASADHFRRHLDFADPVLGPHLLIEEAGKLALTAVRRSGQPVVVAGSVGPYGACLADGSEYTGDYADMRGLDEAEVRRRLSRWHLDRIRRLVKAGVPLLAVETIPCLAEALAVLDCLEEVPGATCWISFQCRRGGDATAKGEDLEDVLRQLMRHPAFRFKVVAVGANCVHPEDVIPILTRYNRVQCRSPTSDGTTACQRVPYVVYPNAGRKYDAEKKTFTGAKSLDPILDHLKTWIALGCNLVGGCCQIGPADIAEIHLQWRLDLYDAVELRAQTETRDDDPTDWPPVLRRLLKPSYDDLKARRQETGVVRDLEGDGGVGPFSRLHRDLETQLLGRGDHGET